MKFKTITIILLVVVSITMAKVSSDKSINSSVSNYFNNKSAKTIDMWMVAW